MLLWSAVAGRIYKLCAKNTSNSGFDRTFMPCSGSFLCAAKQRAGYQISWVNLQREAELSVNLLRSAVASRIYKLCAKNTSNSGFDRTFMPCSG